MTRDFRLRVNGYPVQCHEYELKAVYVRFKGLQIVPVYRDHIGAVSLSDSAVYPQYTPMGRSPTSSIC